MLDHLSTSFHSMYRRRRSSVVSQKLAPKYVLDILHPVFQDLPYST